ncbi:MAG TPA: glycosyltransferase family 2 protein [Thermoplasmatales archaeon]|nr:glycosyltransferase family 2 protein [Thermoplasmatales archaeon]
MMLSVIVPTYNERENLPILVERLRKSLSRIDFEIIVVDDDSPDKTWKIAEELAEEYSFIKVVRRVGEKDLSTAVLKGFQVAKGDILAVMDADLQHPPEKIIDMFRKIEGGADIVIGSRYVEGGEIEEWGIIRKFYSKFATFLAHIFLPKSRLIKDPMSGFFMIERRVIEGVELNPIGYKILLEIVAKGKYERLKEEPIKFSKREKGESSLNLTNQIKYLRHLLRLSWEIKEIHRMLKFAFVGLTGIIVNLGILWVLTEIANIYYLLSAIFSIEASIISNFLLNDLWTFVDRKERGIFNWLKRLIKFNLISTPAFPMQMGVMGFLKEFFGVYYILAALIGILVVFIWNFVANSLWTWRKIY